MFILGSAGFGLLALAVGLSERTAHVDEAVLETLHRHAVRSPALVSAALAVTRLGTLPAFVVLAVVVVTGMWLAGRLRLGLAWLATLIGGGLWVDGLKNIFDRPRPPYNTFFTTEFSYSFPSGHSASSAVAYGMLAYCLALHWRTRRLRLGLLVGFGAFVLLIGFTRLYLGVHYLSDVLAGYGLALAWVSLCVLLIELNRARLSRSPPARPSTPAPGPSPSPARSAPDGEKSG
jgi:undecaprenyl-diphosphatase